MAKIIKMPTSDKRKREISALIDELGALTPKMKPLIKRYKAITKQLKKLPNGTFLADKYEAEISRTNRTVLDTKRIKADMGAGWLTEHEQVVPIFHIVTRTRRIEIAEAPIVQKEKKKKRAA